MQPLIKKYNESKQESNLSFAALIFLITSVLYFVTIFITGGLR